ncbi:transcriptional regulator GcvA [Alphaproteobacteria bacterium GH1-50]|uniref:Transcriptional regulator GcvA n=1 Tax=Kangsaoukella pontilimi TaxID=2691042 RepID=A0A7C9IT40_9RHOB|nr:transcriptional regulator GcvA [Kangsaoukella pontilimi]MXQ09286.1 transcriptional regulator GcvA [Kangsaoukella pontilimi]
MNDRLPPLTALRAFDAAARHMSFQKAAEELNVTPAALSFQIKSLEEHLGASVFRRLNRAVELTEAGRMLAPGTRDAFAALSAAWRTTRRAADNSVVTVTAGPAITAKWLAPRLFAFATAHPDIELRFTATLRLLDFLRDDVDVAIRFGLGQGDDGLFSKPIIREWLTPMTTPEVARSLKSPEDLLSVTLLHQDDTAFLRPSVQWPTWFRAAGLDAPPSGGPRFSQADHAIDSALTGGGVILGRVSLAARDLLEGRLVMPFDLSITTEAHYRLLCPAGAETRPHIKAFLDWIEGEVAEFQKLDIGRRFITAAEAETMSGVS